MAALDELRDGLLRGLHPSDADTFGDYIIDTFRAFDAAHPKIVDLETVTTADLSRLGFSVRLCTKGDSCTKASP